MTDEVEVSQEIIDEAKSQGWVEQENYRDDAGKWVDAQTFVERGRQINPILRKNNEALRKELAKVKADADEAISAAKEFRTFQQEVFGRRQKEFEMQIAHLKTAKKEAISQGDGDRAVAIDDQIDSIKDAKDKLVAPAAPKARSDAPTIDPKLEAWMNRNEWYGKDSSESVELTEMTNGIAAAIRRADPSLSGDRFLEKLDERLTERGIGKTKRVKEASPVEGSSGTRPSGAKGKGYNDLPSDAKAACDRFVKQKLMTREQYLAEYQFD